MAANTSPSSSTLPGNPRELTPEEMKQQRQLIIAVTTAVSVAVAEAWVANKQTQVLAAAGITMEFMREVLTKFYVGLAVVSFLAMREIAKARLNTERKDAPTEAEIDEVTEIELLFEREFARKGATRLVEVVHNAAVRAINEGRENDLRNVVREEVEKAVAKEQEFARMRLGAMGQRIERKVDEVEIRRISPEGAYWMLDLSRKTHTPDCVVMANRAWTWRVLNLISPSNRHFGCGCRLIPLYLARAGGMPNADVVRDDAPDLALASTVL